MAKKKAKKAAKKKAKKKVFEKTIYCNTVTDEGTHYKYFNGNEGDPDYDCAQIERAILKSRVKSVEPRGVCASGKNKFKITYV